MKLVFFCTSLAPGRDGVGDYVRQLASACAQLGHVCLLVALNDRALSAGEGLQQRAGEIRLSNALGWAQRGRMLAGLVRDFEPHWISWQLVPFGFDPKGVIPAGVLALADATRGWRNQVMLHELWVGIARGDRLRLRMLGALQRRRLFGFLRRIAPACLHTTNTAYQFALAHHGWPAGLLPLFGNMPVQPVNSEVATAELAEVAGGQLPPAPYWLGVIFGTIHPQWRPEPTLAWLEAAAKISGRQICLLAIGRPGAHGGRLLERLGARHSPVRVISAGAHSPERISRLLQAADFGLAMHPWALIAKSGTTATLLEHGLPVLVPRDDWSARWGGPAPSADPLLQRLGKLAPADFPRWLQRRRPPESRLPAIASEFVHELNAVIPGGSFVA